ncbi:hypothetical protein [Desulfatitalea alkaliphila]|uniref:Uncharacterized protein n=1 Tax=Desulfatitalea alkaliphila TaxID=2929485 RepID=A0AA41R7Q2_9BACT|nr:hypothetical protein [Desulfatitalea alkaliphila]MCJ8503181.1 hypothetical protein [Desulfatitalea alkaliphila]
MRRYFYFGLVAFAALLYFFPFEHNSGLYRIQQVVKSIGKSEADYRNELMLKQQELRQYEDMIQSITIQIENIIANAPICPKTGRRIEIALDHDPRPEFLSKCNTLREEIKTIEDKLNK